MIRKIEKFIILAIILLSLFTVPVFAREMSIDELGEEALKDNTTLNYIYVVGKYAFTSKYDLKMQDVMLAARSIEEEANDGNINTDPIYNKMAILKITPKKEIVNGKIQITGWQKENDILGGTATLKDNFDIKYIDYKFIAEKSKATIDITSTTEQQYQDYLTKLKFDGNASSSEGLELKDGKLTGLLLQNTKVGTEAFSQDDLTKYYFAYVIKVPGATEATTIKIVGNKEKNITKASFDTNDGIVVLASINPNSDKKTIEITVDIDGAGTEYSATTYSIDWSELRFQQDSVAEIKTDDLPEEDVKYISENWGYTKTDADTYEIALEAGNKYKLTGTIVKQKIKEAAGLGTEGYYVLLNINDTKFIDNTTTVKVPTDGKGGTDIKTVGTDKAGITLLMKLDNENKNDITIEVDIDGEGKEFAPVSYTIDYSTVTFSEPSAMQIAVNEGEIDANTLKNQLNTTFNWQKPANWDVTYKAETDEADETKITIDVTGTLPIMKEVTGFSGEEKTNYYLPVVIKTNITPTDKTKITIPALRATKEVTGTSAWDKIENNDNEIVILMSLKPQEVQAMALDAQSRTFDIVVDMDGDETKYVPYTITIDYTELKFQQETTAEVKVDEASIPEEDKNEIASWGYVSPDNIEIKNQENTKVAYDASTGLLTGLLKEQKLTDGFKQEDLDSYFYTFTIKPNAVTENVKVVIEEVNGQNKKEYNYSDFTNGTLTILQHIPLSTEKCTGVDCPCCQDGKCTGAADCKCNKVLKITVDADGSENVYNESEVYYIDYCNVDFVKLHTVTFKSQNKADTTLKDADGNEITSVEVYDGENLQKPANPVKEQHQLDDSQYNTFDHWNKQTSEAADPDSDTEFNFTQETIKDDVTLYPIWEIDVEQYISDAITHINEKENVQGKFKIEELEADEQKAHKLELDILNRETKLEDITETAIASTIAHALASGEIDTIELALGNNEKEFKADGVKDESTIKATVAESLKEFFTETVLSNKSDATLNDLYSTWHQEEDGLKITILPEKTVAQIKDDEAGAGIIYYVDIEEELMISFDAGVLDNPETQYVKTGENLAKLPTPTIPDNEKDYRTFEGWYDESNKVESLTDIKTDKELTAHYNLNVDKFIEDVIADLNSDTTTYSNNFTGKFSLEQNENEITINVDGANVPLTELAETSIPGAIAYILDKGEIKDITLQVGEQTAKFEKEYTAEGDKVYNDESGRTLLTESGKALKKEIVEGAKNAFDKDLSNHEDTATLDQLEYENKEFSITIGDTIGDTVKLVDNDKADITNKKYTFKFDSDFAVVKGENNTELGAENITEALKKVTEKGYTTIYIDGDITAEAPIDIKTDVTIKPVASASEASLASEEPTTTISVTGDKDYVIDVQSGNVTITDLKLIGGKKAELRVEDGATVTAKNIDVSGLEEAAKDRDEEIHASIIVKGTLNAENIKNTTEDYSKPTIAVVTSYSYQEENKDAVGDEDRKPTHQLATNDATVNVTGMKKIDKYDILDKTTNPKVHRTKETYFGSFYYTNPNNSELYFVGIMDLGHEFHPYDYIQIYYYDEYIDFGKNIDCKIGETTDDTGAKVLTRFALKTDSSQVEIKGDGTEKAQDIFKSHTTNVVYAHYDVKPSASLGFQELPGIEAQGNRISGILSTQNKEGKFVIPVTLTSEKFQDNKSTVKVTNPNGVETTYKYSENNEIATVSNLKTMKLELEAIKTSNITTENGKEYTIAVDMDGDEENYEVYTVDYSGVETLEEIINNAAINTQGVNNLTYTKNNKIKDNPPDVLTVQYNKEAGTRLFQKGESYQYAFPEKLVNPTTNSKKIIVIEKSEEMNKSDRPALNEWRYFSSFDSVSSGVLELSLLKDIIKENKTIGAIDRVVAKENEENTYIVTVNNEIIGNWLNGAYVDFNTGDIKEENGNEAPQVKLEVKLDKDQKYVTSIKTVENFTITKEDEKGQKTTYKDNRINVQITEIGTTSIQTPQEVLETDDETIQGFIKDGRAWWSQHTGSTTYEG